MFSSYFFSPAKALPAGLFTELDVGDDAAEADA